MSFQHSSRLRAALLGATAIIAAAQAAPVVAQPVAVDIAAQDLGSALQSFAVSHDLEILYSPDLVSNLRTPGASGRHEPAEALRLILRGTGLTFSQPSPNVFVLRRAGAADAGQGAAARVAQTSAGAQQSAARAGAGVERGSLGGAVFDAATGTPLAGAAVRIEGTDLTAVTDERGVYRFPAVPAGTHTVVLDYLGDAPQSQQVTVAAAAPATLDFTRGGAGATIVVLGHRSAIQQALNQQRTASNSSTVVSEDFLGGFPAETVSEALRRVPGVAFGRDEASGEGSRITVRGFSSEAINVQVNGLELNGTNFERTIDLGGYLADNISQITIHKTLLPSHEATGSGGLVEIDTRSGLDYGDFHLSGSLEGERPVERGFGREYQVSGTAGGKITPNFGIVGSVSYRDTSRSGNDILILSNLPSVLPAGFTSVFFVPADQQFPFDEEFNSRLITSTSYSQRQRDETSLLIGINAALDIQDHTRLRLDAQRNELDQFNYLSRSAIGFLGIGTGVDMPVPELGGEVRRRAILNSFRPSFGTTASDKNRVTTTVSLRGDTDIDRWQFRYKAGYSGTRERAGVGGINFLGNTFTNLRDIIDPATIQIAPDDDAAQTPRVIGGGFIELENGLVIPSLTQRGFDIVFDPATYRITSANQAVVDSKTDGLIAEASGRYSPDTWLDYVEVGAKYDRVKRSAIDDLFATTSRGLLRNVSQFLPITGRNTFISDIDPALLGSLDLGDIGLDGFGVPVITSASHDAFFEALSGLTADDPATTFNEARFTFNDLSDADPITTPGALQPAASVEERWSGYVESHLEVGNFDAILGARVERVDRTGTTLSIPTVTLNEPGFRQEPRQTFVAAGLVDFVNTQAVDTTITPSFLINYRPNNSIVARLGYFRSTVLPSLESLRRPVQILIDLRPTQNRAILREGNPDLRPTVTDNWDLDVAYYFRDAPGLLRAGIFYKKVNNNFTNIFVQDAPAEEVRQRILDRFEPLAATRPDLIAFNDDTEFLLSRPQNGEGGTIYGFEAEAIRQFNFLPGLLSGFGVIANLTYTKGDFPTLVSGRDAQGNVINVSLDRPLADQAAWVYNAALTYSRGGFESRLIYTKQTSSVIGYDIHDLNEVIPGYSTLDLRMSYNFNGPGGGLYTLFLEGDDLLRDADDPDVRNATTNTFGRADAQFFFPNTLQFSGGRTVTFGARVRF